MYNFRLQIELELLKFIYRDPSYYNTQLSQITLLLDY